MRRPTSCGWSGLRRGRPPPEQWLPPRRVIPPGRVVPPGRVAQPSERAGAVPGVPQRQNKGPPVAPEVPPHGAHFLPPVPHRRRPAGVVRHHFLSSPKGSSEARGSTHALHRGSAEHPPAAPRTLAVRPAGCRGVPVVAGRPGFPAVGAAAPSARVWGGAGKRPVSTKAGRACPGTHLFCCSGRPGSTRSRGSAPRPRS